MGRSAPNTARVLSSALLFGLVLLGAGASLASKPRLRLERIDASKCASDGLVRAYAVEIELEGILRPRPATQYQLFADGKVIAGRPEGVTSYGETKRPIMLALIVETSSAYAGDMDKIKRGLRALLGALPRRSRVTVIAYSWEVEQLVTRAPVRKAEGAIDDLQVQSAGSVDLALAEAIKRGLRALGTDADERRVLVVVSDGINQVPDWDLFRALGKRAGGRGIPIFPVGYSPIDERGPLLNLGEIAKRSRGTFRWAREANRIRGELANLGRELVGQLVLTFRVKDRCRERLALQVGGGALLSNKLIVPAQKAVAGAAKAEGGSRKVWIIVAAVAGALVALALLLLAARWLFRGGASRAGPARAAKEERAQGPDAAGAEYVLLGATPRLRRLNVDLEPGRWSIGSSIGCRIQLPEGGGVAARHAELIVESGALAVSRLSGQVAVNGRPIESATPLDDGDRIQLGAEQLLVRRR